MENSDYEGGQSKIGRRAVLAGIGAASIPTWSRMLEGPGEDGGPETVRSTTLYNTPSGQLPEGPRSARIKNPYTGDFVRVSLGDVGRDASGAYADLIFDDGEDSIERRAHEGFHGWGDLPESYQIPDASVGISGVGPHLNQVSSNRDAQVTLGYHDEAVVDY